MIKISPSLAPICNRCEPEQKLRFLKITQLGDGVSHTRRATFVASLQASWSIEVRHREKYPVKKGVFSGGWAIRIRNLWIHIFNLSKMKTSLHSISAYPQIGILLLTMCSCIDPDDPKPSTGTYTIWTQTDQGQIDIYLDGEYQGRVTHYHPNGVDCGLGDVNMKQKAGTYAVTASSTNGGKWEGDITFEGGKCKAVELPKSTVTNNSGNSGGAANYTGPYKAIYSGLIAAGGHAYSCNPPKFSGTDLLVQNCQGGQIATYVVTAINAAQALECAIKANSPKGNIDLLVDVMRTNIRQAAEYLPKAATGKISCLTVSVTAEQIRQWANAGP